MERRRTDRRVQLEVVLAYLFCSLQCPITDIAFPQWAPQDGTFGPLTCANPVPGNPDFVTRKVISGHEVCFAVLCAAVNRAQWGVLRYLEGAESKEADVWRQQDYRTAQLVLVLADEGKPNPYSKAFFQLFGKHAHQIRFWWRDRQKLYRLCELGGSNTPLLHSDLAYRYQDALVPDFDYSQVSSGGAHAERNRAALKGGQLPPAACTARQSGPLEKASPVAHVPPAAAKPANRPAPSRAGAGFPKSRRTA